MTATATGTGAAPRRSVLHPFRRTDAEPGAAGRATVRATGAGGRRSGASKSTSDGAGERHKQPTSAATRRNRIPVAVAGLFAVLVLVAGFPAASLLSQHHQLSAAAAQLSQLQQNNSQLAQQEKALDSKTEINRLARQNYQMVTKGQVLYDVLPPSGQRASTVPGGTQSGDPGNQPLVAPSNAPDMSPDPGLPKTPAPASSTPSGGTGSGQGSPAATPGGTGSSSSFWGRVANTLEFWQ